MGRCCGKGGVGKDVGRNDKVWSRGFDRTTGKRNSERGGKTLGKRNRKKWQEGVKQRDLRGVQGNGIEREVGMC